MGFLKDCLVNICPQSESPKRVIQFHLLSLEVPFNPISSAWESAAGTCNLPATGAIGVGGSLCFSHKSVLIFICTWLWRGRQVRSTGKIHSSCEDPTHNIISSSPCLQGFCWLFSWDISRWTSLWCKFGLLSGPKSREFTDTTISKAAQPGIPRIETLF